MSPLQDLVKIDLKGKFVSNIQKSQSWPDNFISGKQFQKGQMSTLNQKGYYLKDGMSESAVLFGVPGVPTTSSVVLLS
jgi:hypothetical protein